MAAATFFALSWGYGLVGLCAVNAGGDLLGYALRLRVAYRILPQLQDPRGSRRGSICGRSHSMESGVSSAQVPSS